MKKSATLFLSAMLLAAAGSMTVGAEAQVIKPVDYQPPVTYQPIPIPLPPNNHRLQVLIITGRGSYEHNWIATTNAIRRILQDTGRFEVRVTEEFRGATAETLKPYNLVILNYLGRWNYDDPTELRWGPGPEKALFDFVRNGGGLVVYHSSFSIGMPSWPEYEKMVGGVTQVAPGDVTKTTRRSPPLAFMLHVTDRNNPITQGMREYMWDYDDDMLANLKWAPGVKVNVLVKGYDNPAFYAPKLSGPKYPPSIYTPKNMKKMPGMGEENPLVWTLNYGKGRVFAFLPGHEVVTLFIPGVRSLLERGSEWAATGKVTIPVEKDAAAYEGGK